MPIPEKLVAGINRLDPLSPTMRRLMEALDDEDVSVTEIAKIVENDQAVAANLLRMANSAMFRGKNVITDIRSATTRLGMYSLLEIALGGHIRKLAIEAPMYGLTEDDLWLHAATSARAVAEIKRKVSEATIPQVATISALMHDVGKLIMIRYLDADVQAIHSLCTANNLTFVEAEQELFGCDHAEVGGAIARAWSFPEPIAEAIALHHEVNISEPSQVLDVVAMANFVSKTVGVGLGAEGMNFRVDAGCLDRLGLDFMGFCEVCASIALDVEELRRIALS